MPPELATIGSDRVRRQSRRYGGLHNSVLTSLVNPNGRILSRDMGRGRFGYLVGPRGRGEQENRTTSTHAFYLHFTVWQAVNIGISTPLMPRSLVSALVLSRSLSEVGA